MDFATIDRSIELGTSSLIGMVWKHKVIFLLSFTACLSLLVVGTLALQPLYEASALLIANQADNLIQQETVDRSSIGPLATQLTMVQIAQSDVVVSRAVEKVGLSKLVAATPLQHTSLALRLRGQLFGDRPGEVIAVTPMEAALPVIKAGLSVRAEPNSNIIHVAYRNKNPRIAEMLVNALSQAFIEQNILLFSRPGAAEFLKRQKQRFDNEAKLESQELAAFSSTSGTYATDDQRKLLLTRASEMSAAIAATHATTLRLTAFRQTLGDQLRRLAPVTHSPWIYSLVEGLSGASAPAQSSASVPTTDPPLLLVKVYQDSMVKLFEVNAEISGSLNTEVQQAAELANITAQLNRLTANEQQYAQLKDRIAQAYTNSNIYAARMVAQEIDDASTAAKFSSVKVLEAATAPVRPIFPNYYVMLFGAVIISAVLAASAVGLRALTRSRR